MSKQIVFAIIFCIGSGCFLFTIYRLYRLFKLTKPDLPIRQFGKRILITLQVAFGQKKILRKPLIGFMHAIVWWGFLVILFGTCEMVVDGFTGNERVFSFYTGWFYDLMTASGDIFALLIIFICVAYLIRRNIMSIRRFEGIEMSKKTHMDANLAIVLILALMLSLIGMNIGYLQSNQSYAGTFPVSTFITHYTIMLPPDSAYFFLELNWWSHIILIILFLNILPYSKHFHVIMSVPNVFFSNFEPIMKMRTMEDIQKEIRVILHPQENNHALESSNVTNRFGIMDIEDITWKQYMDSITCTQCGRCTEACPANNTGKILSPRKIMVDTRKRMKEKGYKLVRNNSYSDNKTLAGDILTREEIWACTTCHACVVECPLNINHLSLIMDIRRYFVLEKGVSRPELTQMFNNIENNGAPWQYARVDRLNWSKNIFIKKNE